MKRALALPCIAAAFLVACNESDMQMPLPDGPSALIVDGAHGSSGNPAFFFLPPLVVNPSSSSFGEFDRDAIATIEVCRQLVADGLCDALETRVLPTEIDGRSDHFHYGLKMSDITTNNPNDVEYFRINVMIGNTSVGVVADLGTRDIAVNAPGCGDATASILCVDQSETVAIKFRIDKDASCFTPGVAFPDPDCASTTTFGTPTTASTGSGGATITAPALDLGAGVGDRYTLRFQQVPFNECDLGALGLNQEIGLQDGGFHPMQWAQFPICYRVSTATQVGAEVDINDVVVGLAEYEIVFDHPGETFPPASLLRLARMSDDRTELQILARPPVAAGYFESPSLGTKLWNLARRLIDGSLFAPKPALAVVKDEGVGGLGDLSIIGVVYPASLTHPDLDLGEVDLGVVAPGDAVQVGVFARDTEGNGVENNDVTFQPGAGDLFNGSAGATDVRSDATGSAAGTWTIAGGATGVRTLTASCFPCSTPPVTGDDLGDGGGDLDFYDNLFPFASHPPQTITFKAVVLSLSVDPIPSRGIVGVLFPVRICIGASVPDVVIRFAGRANNGTPTEVLVNGTPGLHTLNTTNVTFEPANPGCFTAMISVTKEGGVRLIVSIEGTSLIVETNKSNIRPK